MERVNVIGQSHIFKTNVILQTIQDPLTQDQKHSSVVGVNSREMTNGKTCWGADYKELEEQEQ